MTTNIILSTEELELIFEFISNRYMEEATKNPGKNKFYNLIGYDEDIPLSDTKRIQYNELSEEYKKSIELLFQNRYNVPLEHHFWTIGSRGTKSVEKSDNWIRRIFKHAK